MKFRHKLSSRRLIYAVGAAAVLALIVIVVLHFRGQNAAPSDANDVSVPVTAGVALRKDIPEIVSVLGTVQSIDSVSVQAQVNGPIVKIEFAPGDDVKQGQELFLIDPRPYQAALNEQQAQLAHDEGVLAEAQVDLTRYQTLAEQNSIARQQSEDQVYVVAQDKGTVQLDQANVETAQINLAYCHVLAPITGRAGVLMVDVGNLVGPNQSSSSSGSSSSSATASTYTGTQTPNGTMVQIAQIRPIYVSFNIPQNMLDQIKHNQAISPLEVDAYSQTGELLANGKLTVIDNLVNVSSGTVMMQATFANADEKLWPGEFVRAQLILSIRKNAVTVPSQAVSAGPNGSYLYVIHSDNTVHRVTVDVIDRQGTIAVIGKGLSGGEKIVVDGQYRLDEGVKVDIQKTVESGAA